MMALFEVTRYFGDSDDDVGKKAEESSILEQLNQRAKLGKKKLGKKSKKTLDEKELKEEYDDISAFCSQPDLSKDEVSNSFSEDATSSKSKKKKRKHKHSETSNIDEVLEDGISDRKKVKVEVDETGVQNDSSEHKKSKKDKKKKKKERECFEDGDAVTENENDVKNVAADEDDGKMEIADDTLHDASIDQGEDVEKSEESKNEIGGFTVIGKVRPAKIPKVHRVLPDWLANPSIISADLKSDRVPVCDMPGLAEDLVEKLTENGITHFFPVQTKVIPALLESSLTGFAIGRAGYRPSDVCVSAPTGSGKTLAFVLPIVQALRSRVTCEIRALAVLPVKDLATQVFKVFQTYCKGTMLKVGLLAGQKTFSAEQHSAVKKRLMGYHSMYDIVVATPGRLVDHINQTEGFNLGHLRYLVIDEADRMMDEIKQDWLIQVENAVYKQRSKPALLNAASCMTMEMPLQKLLYSATLSQNPEKLQQLNLFQPKLFTSVVKQSRMIPSKVENKPSLLKTVEKTGVDSGVATSPDNTSNDEHQDSDDVKAKTEDEKDVQETKSDEFVGKYATPTSLSEYFIETTSAQKPLVILHMLHHLKYRNIICFTNSVETTHRLFMLIKLYGGIEVKELSSSIHIARRNDILKKFMSGKIDIVICSDAMARGMDIDNVKYVISYDPPPYIQTYIHRIGRTARAGKDGTAFTLLDNKEFFHFKKMVRDAGKCKLKPLRITKADVKPLVPKYEETLKQLGDKLQYDKTKKRYTSKKPYKSENKTDTG